MNGEIQISIGRAGGVYLALKSRCVLLFLEWVLGNEGNLFYLRQYLKLTPLHLLD